MIPNEVLQTIATDCFYQHLPEETFIELGELLILHYLDENNDPLEDEIVELDTSIPK